MTNRMWQLAICLAGVLFSVSHAAQPHCSRYHNQVTRIHKEVKDPIYFCRFFIAEPRSKSPIPGIGASALDASCRCLLKASGKYSSPPPPSRSPLDPSSLSCKYKYTSRVKAAFKHSKDFCVFYNSKPRDRSPILGLSLTNVMEACNCIEAPVSSPTRTSTHLTTTTLSSTTLSNRSTSPVATNRPATSMVDHTSTTTTSIPTTTSTPTTSTTAPSSTTTTTTSRTTTPLPSTTTTKTSISTTTTTETTTSTTIASPTTSTSPTPTCTLYAPEFLSGSASNSLASASASASYSLIYSGISTVATSISMVAGTFLDPTLAVPDAVSSCASYGVANQNYTQQTQLELVQLTMGLFSPAWECLLYTEVEGVHDADAYARPAEVGCAFGWAERAYFDNTRLHDAIWAA
ncbi:hypothetical protein K461DRAFT_305700 [Myriangium duriaei CBS 260.36]|uniref:Apple domain-containing protein n=1 Tax=Myriangium duriaei CBS 260.36 TaxID=1168546 RepID=A0A9P4J0G3_9PEZI|nr:hypothetical protein K461DRAFT_305700 [Myriangium duriaei CBS 260.36]